MPIYEYECTQCGKVEEAFQKFSDPPLTTCSTCSGSLHKIISQSSFHLKGTGWYVTDYANKSGCSSSAKSETSSKPATSDSASDKPSKTADASS